VVQRWALDRQFSMPLGLRSGTSGGLKNPAVKKRLETQEFMDGSMVFFIDV